MERCEADSTVVETGSSSNLETEELESSVVSLSKRRRVSVLEAQQERRRREEQRRRKGEIKEASVGHIQKIDVMQGELNTGRVCVKCEMHGEVEGSPVLRCKDCYTHYHASCLGLDIPSEMSGWKCSACVTGRHKCFLCRKVGDEAETGGPPPLPLPRRCSVSQCGRYFHWECLTITPLWPQAREDPLVCPAHTCHSCASTNPWDPVMKVDAALTTCVRCPTSFHYCTHLDTDCVVAGTTPLTTMDIICYKHYSPLSQKKGRRSRSMKAKPVTVHTDWCAVCGQGGTLVCCELCPTALHPHCREDDRRQLNERFYCPSCVVGKLARYEDIVWVKLGNFRWWPSQVIHPAYVPMGIYKLNHHTGEFVVKFLGTNQYNWINHGRVFPFTEGDRSRSKFSGNLMDSKFRTGLAEATRLCSEVCDAREEREISLQEGKDTQPPPWVRIKTNLAVGAATQMGGRGRKGVVCTCAGEKEGAPCGERSSCINRISRVECSYATCTAASVGNCANMRFTRRQYPPLQVIHRPGLGWGLSSVSLIRSGQFVMEYVGEVITKVDYRVRMAADQESDVEHYYYLPLDTNRIIDARIKGNNARLINHSCEPNCITEVWSVGGETSIGLFAISDIKPGTELTIRYPSETVGESRKKCLCGASSCYGYIGGKSSSGQEQIWLQIERKKRGGLGWEETCFTCQEGGTLLRCDHPSCPKVYHALCVKLVRSPTSPWLCPWHSCTTCSAESEVWCIHCPASFCSEHIDGVRQDPDIGAICSEHEDELEFLRDVWQGDTLKQLLPCPNPTQQQLSVWKTARGLHLEFVDDSDSNHEENGSTDLHKNGSKTKPIQASPTGTEIWQQVHEGLSELMDTLGCSPVSSYNPRSSPPDFDWSELHEDLSQYMDKLNCSPVSSYACSISDHSHSSKQQPDRENTEEGDIKVEKPQLVRCLVSECTSSTRMTDVQFGKHFNAEHREKENVEEEEVEEDWTGKKITLRDLYTKAVRCGYSQCRQILFGKKNETKKEFIKRIKQHWEDQKRRKKTHFEEFSYSILFDKVTHEKDDLLGCITRKVPDPSSKFSPSTKDSLRKKVSPPTPSAVPQYKCMECSHMVTGPPRSPSLIDHWVHYHSNLPLVSLHYSCLSTSNSVTLSDVCYCIQCDKEDCNQVFTNVHNLESARRAFLFHWVRHHQGEPRSRAPVMLIKKETVSNPKNLANLYSLKGFQCRVNGCKTEVSSIQSLYSHASQFHEETSLEKQSALHILSGRVVRHIELYPHVLECGRPGCHVFVGRSKAFRDQAVKKLRRHWEKEHGDLDRFVYTEIGEGGDKEQVDGKSRLPALVVKMDEQNSRLTIKKIKKEKPSEDGKNEKSMQKQRKSAGSINTLPKPFKNVKESPMKNNVDKYLKSNDDESKGKIIEDARLIVGITKCPVKVDPEEATPLGCDLAESEEAQVRGPFRCNFPDCLYICTSYNSFAKHWNSRHPEDPSKACFKDKGTNNTVCLLDIFQYVLQCKICLNVKCAQEDSTKAYEKMREHIKSKHPKKVEEDGSELYFVLKHFTQSDKATEVEMARSGTVYRPVNLTKAEAKYAYRNVPHHSREGTYKGPFICLLCGINVTQKHLLMHKNIKHPGLNEEFAVTDVASGTRLDIHDLFKFLGVCLYSGCGKFMGQNASYEVLRYNLMKHFQKDHGEVPSNFQCHVILPPNLEMEANLPIEELSELKSKEKKKIKSSSEKKKKVKQVVPEIEDAVSEPSCVTVARYVSDCNTSFSQKGFQGPFRCLGDGCNFSTVYSLAVQKHLVGHWTQVHGDVVTMLYLDTSSLTVLNVKVICNNVAYCSFPDCRIAMYSSRKTDFPNAVAAHWRNSHSESSITSTHDRVRLITVDMVPSLTNDIATSLVRHHGLLPLQASPKTPRTPMTPTTPGPRAPKTPKIQCPTPQTVAENTKGLLTCCECGYIIRENNTAWNRLALNHWTWIHGNPTHLQFTDSGEDGAVLGISSLFRVVVHCTAPGCDFYSGRNGPETATCKVIRDHWVKQHSHLPECKDTDKYTVLHSEDALLDGVIEEVGQWRCEVDQCGLQMGKEEGWQETVLNHFHTGHDLLIDALLVRELPSGKLMRIQDLFQYVGQCNQSDCLDIIGVNSKKAQDGEKEMQRIYKAHFGVEHPGIQVSFAVLVENHEARFLATQD